MTIQDIQIHDGSHASFCSKTTNDGIVEQCSRESHHRAETVVGGWSFMTSIKPLEFQLGKRVIYRRGCWMDNVVRCERPMRLHLVRFVDFILMKQLGLHILPPAGHA